MKITKRCFIFTVVLIMNLVLFEMSPWAEEVMSRTPQKDIIGKWISLDKSWILEFKENGKLLSQLDRGNVKFDTESKTIFIDDNHLLGVWDRNMQAYEVRVYPKKILLIGSDGKETQFHRMK